MCIMDYKYNSKSLRIAELYKEFLLKRRIKAGTKARSVRQLMSMYHISSTTADKVLRHLTEQDILYRIPSKGTFVKHDPPVELLVGFTDTEFCPPYASDFDKMHVNWSVSAFKKLNLTPRYISYDELVDPERAETAFSQINALLLQGNYIDERTLPQLKKFQGPIVIVNIYFPAETFLVSQVFPDFEAALRDLEPDIRKFKRLLIFSAGHNNAVQQEKLIRKIFSGKKIETVLIRVEQPNCFLKSFRYFLARQTGYEDALLIMLSGWFSTGLKEAFGTKPLPCVLEIDNFEACLPDAEQNAVFTAIEPRFQECYIEGLKLLKSQLENQSSDRRIVMVKPEIIIRKSFTPEIYLKTIKNKEST